MNWYKKSQNLNDFQSTFVEEILKANMNGSPQTVREQFESKGIQNYCEILEKLCTASGQLVPPFYMSIWTSLCGSVYNENEQEQQPVVQNNETELNANLPPQ